MVHTKSKDMIVDGLIKVLSADNFRQFLEQLGLVEVKNLIKDQEEHHDDYEFLFNDNI